MEPDHGGPGGSTMTETQINLEGCKQSLIDVVQHVCTTMLDTPAEVVERAPWSDSRHCVVGTTHFGGEWKGALRFECRTREAAAFTSQLVGIAPPQTVNHEVRDAIGEIANMIAGNVKPILPTGAVLSGNTVVEGSRFTLKVCGGDQSIRFEFAARGPFTVTLFHIPEE